MTEGSDIGLASRRTAWRIVRRVHADEAWAGPAVDQALRRSGLGARDRAFATNLAYETLRWEGTLDWALSHVVTRPLEQVEREVLDVLRLGTWQILFGGTPDRAAVATAVDVARTEVGERATGFVNGVLRNLARAHERLPWPAESTDEGLGLRTGYAPWVVEAARERFGAAAAAELRSGNVAPGVTLRAVGDIEELAAELAAGGLETERGVLAPEALRAGGTDPARLAAVAQGRAVVQDEASMVVARAAAERAAAGAADRQPWRALDVAAAPGGKSTHLAQRGGWVVSSELRPGRARMIVDAAARLGFGDRVRTVVADGTRPAWRDSAFDVVLLDAPCTGFGVVRRRPELRWRRGPDDPERLAGLQTQLLEHAADAVAPGGTLLYSVCTWTVEETVAVVRPFLALHGDRFTADPLGLASAATTAADDPGTQLATHAHGTDGMYVCRFRRRE